MNTHTLYVEPGALDNVPLIKLAALLAQYGSEIVNVDGRLVVRKVPTSEARQKPRWADGPENAA